jgi:hypothetical protein
MADKRIDSLLKSSLPLENQVAAIADDCSFFNCGEFPYSRVNEVGQAMDFSIDLLVSANLYADENADVGKDVSVLIECKYASPSVQWVFSTVPKHEPIEMSGLSSFPLNSDYRLSGLHTIVSLEPQAYCTRGVSLSTTSADPAQIRHGLQQLRYAIPNLLRSLYIENRDLDMFPSIPIIVPLLVTNAPLRVLNADAGIAMASQSVSLEQVTTLHSHLCVYQKAGPELKALCYKMATELAHEFGWPVTSPLSGSLATDLIDSVESIQIISLHRLSDHLHELRRVVSGLKVVNRPPCPKCSSLGSEPLG